MTARFGLLGVDRGTICLTLDCPMSGHGREACVSLQVEDADAYYDEWRYRDTRRPHDQPLTRPMLTHTRHHSTAVERHTRHLFRRAVNCGNWAGYVDTAICGRLASAWSWRAPVSRVEFRLGADKQRQLLRAPWARGLRARSSSAMR